MKTVVSFEPSSDAHALSCPGVFDFDKPSAFMTRRAVEYDVDLFDFHLILFDFSHHSLALMNEQRQLQKSENSFLFEPCGLQVGESPL